MAISRHQPSWLEGVTHPRANPGYRHCVEETRAVLERLERIEALDRAGAEPAELVAELRALLEEATAWSRADGGDAGERAIDRLRQALTRDMIAV